MQSTTVLMNTVYEVIFGFLDDVWHCPTCSEGGGNDGIYQYSTGLLWLLLNDRLRRTAIRNGDGPMMMKFWQDDIINFWNSGHPKYLILAHRMTAGKINTYHSMLSMKFLYYLNSIQLDNI